MISRSAAACCRTIAYANGPSTDVIGTVDADLRKAVPAEDIRHREKERRRTEERVDLEALP